MPEGTTMMTYRQALRAALREELEHDAGVFLMAQRSGSCRQGQGGVV
jgi:pyruvate/2-oxoglutarate/acetoin dehydrogenase E1 component